MGRLAGEHLAQRDDVEVAHACLTHATGDEAEVGDVLVAVERGAALALHFQRDGVGVEIGLAGIHFHAVGEREFGEAMLIGLLADNRAGLRQLTHQVVGQLLLGVGRIVQALGGQDDLFDLSLAGQNDTFLVGGIHDYDLVLVGNQFPDGGVDLVEGDLTVEFAGILQLKFGRHQRLSRQEVVHAGVDKVGIAVIVAHLVTALGGIEVEAAGTVQLALGKAMLAGLLGNTHSGDDAAQDVVLLAADAHGKGLLGAADEERRGASRGALDGRSRLLTQFGETVVEHGADQAVDVIAAQVGLAVLLGVGRGVAFLIQVAQDDGLLGILPDGDNHLVVVIHGIVDALSRFLGHGDGRENLLDFLLHLVHVDVTHDDDGLQVGAVPLLVIVAQVLIGEMVDDVHRADGHAVLVFRPAVDDGQDVLLHALHGHSRTAGAPFLMDDAALLVNLLVLEQQVVAPVVEHQQARVDDALAHQRCRPDVIDRLVD